MLARQEAEFEAQEVDDSNDAEKGDREEAEAAHLVTLPTAIAISLATALLSTALTAGLVQLSALLCPAGDTQVNQQDGIG